MKEWTLRTASGETRIILKGGGLRELRRILENCAFALPASIASNSTVAPLYAGRVAEEMGLESWIEIPDGESYKNWESVETLCRYFLREGVYRGSSVLALGGGVITDLSGFAASIFMRGISWIAVPTSLLAMVDASIGGKTGMNLNAGKNLLGTFWPPQLVLIDPETLATLPERELRSGLAEVLKAGWIADPDLMDHTRRIQGDGLRDLISRAIEVKVRIVEADERESGARKALNLGHTLGHALESLSEYRGFLHGEAVAWGMRFVAGVSRRRGLLSEKGYLRRIASIDTLGPLPPVDHLDPEAVTTYLLRDKKRDAEGVAWVLPTDDGVILDQRVEAKEIREFFGKLQV